MEQHPLPPSTERQKRVFSISDLLIIVKKNTFTAIGLSTAIGVYWVTAGEIVYSVIGGLVAGLFGPWYRHRKDTARRREARRDLPLFLDLTNLALRAGLGFCAALSQGAAALPAGPLHQELEQVLARYRHGEMILAALEQCAKRLALEEFDFFCEAVALSLSLGGDLSRTISAQAVLQRRLAYLRQERFAQTAPVRIMAPLFLFIFPTIFLLIFGPLYLQYGSGRF